MNWVSQKKLQTEFWWQSWETRILGQCAPRWSKLVQIGNSGPTGPRWTVWPKVIKQFNLTTSPPKKTISDFFGTPSRYQGKQPTSATASSRLHSSRQLVREYLSGYCRTKVIRSFAFQLLPWMKVEWFCLPWKPVWNIETKIFLDKDA